MNVITDMPAAATSAGVSPAELAVMREAAGNLAGTGRPTGAPDPFAVLAAPFVEYGSGGPGRWTKTVNPTMH